MIDITSRDRLCMKKKKYYFYFVKREVGVNVDAGARKNP